MTPTLVPRVVQTLRGALTIYPDADPLARQQAGEVVAYRHADRRTLYVRGMTRTMGFVCEVSEADLTAHGEATALDMGLTTVLAAMRKHGHTGAVVLR